MPSFGPPPPVPRYKEGIQIQYVGADAYYSPNNWHERRRISLNPIVQNPFNPIGGRPPSIRYRDLSPRPWTSTFGWTSFIPVIPCYDTTPRCILSVLCHPPPIERLVDEFGKHKGFSLIRDNAWYTLEQNIYKAVCALKHTFHLSVVLPFLPHVLGYNSTHTNRISLEQSLAESREWFLVWFGAFSYCLYASEQHPDAHRRRLENRYPYWRKPLEDAGLSDAWIDEVIYSPIFDFETVPRLGSVILEVHKRPSEEPLVLWFLDAGVPVWYRWSSVEEATARDWEWAAVYRPIASLEASPRPCDAPASPKTPPRAWSILSQDEMSPSIGQASSMRVGEAGLSRADDEMVNAEEPMASDDPGKKREGGGGLGGDPPSTSNGKEPEWVAFFRSREAERPALLARETPQQRERRLNRMREPPTSSARVFEWSLDEKSEAEVWIRVPVPAKWRADTLMDHGKAQRRYDPFHNEWDVCTEFGQMTQEEEEQMDAFGGYCPGRLLDNFLEEVPLNPSLDNQGLTGAPPTPGVVVSVPGSIVEGESLANRDPSSLTAQPIAALPRIPLVELDPPSDLFHADDPSGQEIEEVFTIFYGLAYPVPGTTLPGEGNEGRRDIFLRLLGQIGAGTAVRSKEGFFSSKPYLPAQHLLHCILDRVNEFRGVWDLQEDCVHPIKLRPRFQTLSRAELTPTPKTGPPKGNDIFDNVDVCYILREAAPSVPWKLALISSSIALAVCRLPEDFSALDIAMWCAQRGVPFRVLYPYNSPTLRSPRPHKPFPIPVRPFDHKFTREDYDSYVHIRTRLLGQSHMQAALKRGGIVWRLALGTLGISEICDAPSLRGGTRRLVLGDSTFFDNALTMDELDVICGAYECISDDGKRRALKSWWPLGRYYEKEECGENYGRWTLRREAWYAKRLQDIEKDDFSAKPYTYTEWKSLQHGPRVVRTFHSVIEKTSLEVLKGHCISSS